MSNIKCVQQFVLHIEDVDIFLNKPNNHNLITNNSYQFPLQ